MGVAIIIKGADFKSAGLGKVTTEKTIELDIRKRIQFLTSAGATLLYGTEEDTVSAVMLHKQKLGGVPKLDFIAYEGPSTAITKLYSLDPSFDTQDGDILQNVDVSKKGVLCKGGTNQKAGIRFHRLFRNLTKVYYKNSVQPWRGDQFYESFYGNLLKTDDMNIVFIFDYSGNHITVQYSPDIYKSYGDVRRSGESVECFIELKDSFVLPNLQKITVDGKDITASEMEGDAYWLQQYKDWSSIGIGVGECVIYGL